MFYVIKHFILNHVSFNVTGLTQLQRQKHKNKQFQILKEKLMQMTLFASSFCCFLTTANKAMKLKH